MPCHQGGFIKRILLYKLFCFAFYLDEDRNDFFFFAYVRGIFLTFTYYSSSLFNFSA